MSILTSSSPAQLVESLLLSILGLSMGQNILMDPNCSSETFLWSSLGRISAKRWIKWLVTRKTPPWKLRWWVSSSRMAICCHYWRNMICSDLFTDYALLSIWVDEVFSLYLNLDLQRLACCLSCCDPTVLSSSGWLLFVLFPCPFSLRVCPSQHSWCIRFFISTMTIWFVFLVLVFCMLSIFSFGVPKFC